MIKKMTIFFKKSGYYTIRLVLYFKQNKHHSGQEKKNKSGNPQIDHSVHYILIIDFQYFFKECHTYDNKTKKVFFYF